MISRNGDSPAGRALSEAIELAIAEESPYPDAAMFINADTPFTEREIAMAFEREVPRYSPSRRQHSDSLA